MRDNRQRISLPICVKSGKKSHPDYHSAARHIREHFVRIERDSADNYDIYRCKHCNHWHVGHSRKPDKEPTQFDELQAEINAAKSIPFEGKMELMPKQQHKKWEEWLPDRSGYGVGSVEEQLQWIKKRIRAVQLMLRDCGTKSKTDEYRRMLLSWNKEYQERRKELSQMKTVCNSFLEAQFIERKKQP